MFCLTDVVSNYELKTNKLPAPERELLIAVLDRAVLDYCGREGELHEKAKEWIFIDSDYEDVFSFVSICYHLGLDKSALRHQITKLEIPKNVSQAHRWLRGKVQKSPKLELAK